MRHQKWSHNSYSHSFSEHSSTEIKINNAEISKKNLVESRNEFQRELLNKFRDISNAIKEIKDCAMEVDGKGASQKKQKQPKWQENIKKKHQSK